MDSEEYPLNRREKLERIEHSRFAPYAQFSGESAGRVHPEPPHPYRTAYQRDRARIIHSRAFRRLAYKTQVFLSGTGDHLRTRLTHTIEVASVGRTIATALGANEDLVDCIALAHDLGHAPFGHSGEDCLDELMRDHGGFEHNLQSLRIVRELEAKYPAFPGLNLSFEVCEGLQKSGHSLPRPGGEGEPETTFPQPSLEAQIADLADEITYYSHDLDDGLDHGLLQADQLDDLEIWQVCRERVQSQFPGLDGERFLPYAIRSLIDFEVADTVAATHRRIREAAPDSADAVRAHPEPLATYSPDVARANQELRRYLREHLYFHPSVAEPNQCGCAMIATLFEIYRREPDLMGDYAANVRESADLPRIVCDYLSGMTDRFLEAEYRLHAGGAGSP